MGKKTEFLNVQVSGTYSNDCAEVVYVIFIFVTSPYSCSSWVSHKRADNKDNYWKAKTKLFYCFAWYFPTELISWIVRCLFSMPTLLPASVQTAKTWTPNGGTSPQILSQLQNVFCCSLQHQNNIFWENSPVFFPFQTELVAWQNDWTQREANKIYTSVSHFLLCVCPHVTTRGFMRICTKIRKHAPILAKIRQRTRHAKAFLRARLRAFIAAKRYTAICPTLLGLSDCACPSAWASVTHTTVFMSCHSANVTNLLSK